MFGADVRVVERFGFLAGERQDLLDTRGVRDVPDHLLVRPGADLFFDFHANGFQVQTQFLEDIDGDALPQFDQAQQEMFGADKIVVEPVGFFARQREDLLRPGREIVHRFFAHILHFKLQSIRLFVHSRPRRCGWFSHRATDVPEPFANHIRTKQVAFLGGEFLRMLFLQVRRLGQNEQLIHQRPVHPRKHTHIHA